MSKCAELARQRQESNGEKVLIHAEAFPDGCGNGLGSEGDEKNPSDLPA